MTILYSAAIYITSHINIHLTKIPTLKIITCSAVILDADWSIGVSPGAVHTF